MRTLSIIIFTLFCAIICNSQVDNSGKGAFYVLLEKTLPVESDSEKTMMIPQKIWTYQVSLPDRDNDTLSYNEETFENNITQLEKYVLIKSLVKAEKETINYQGKRALAYLKHNNDLYDVDYYPPLLANKQGTYAVTLDEFNTTFKRWEVVNLKTMEHYHIFPFGHNWAKTLSWSNDGFLLADEIEEYSNDSIKFAVHNVLTRELILSKIFPYHSIHKIAWNNRSNKIAILFKTANRKWYLDILNLILGHGGPFWSFNYHLIVMDLSGNILFSKTLLSKQDNRITSELIWTK